MKVGREVTATLAGRSGTSARRTSESSKSDALVDAGDPSYAKEKSAGRDLWRYGGDKGHRDYRTQRWN